MLVDLYELSMSASYFEFKKDTKAVFDLFIRRMPVNRSYFVAAGLDDILDFLSNFLNFFKKFLHIFLWN